MRGGMGTRQRFVYISSPITCHTSQRTCHTSHRACLASRLTKGRRKAAAGVQKCSPCCGGDDGTQRLRVEDAAAFSTSIPMPQHAASTISPTSGKTPHMKQATPKPNSNQRQVREGGQPGLNGRGGRKIADSSVLQDVRHT